MTVGVKGEEAAKPVTTVGHFQHFCVRPLDIFQDTSGQFPASFTATKKKGIFNRSQDISRRVCTNQNTR